MRPADHDGPTGPDRATDTSDPDLSSEKGQPCTPADS